MKKVYFFKYVLAVCMLALCGTTAKAGVVAFDFAENPWGLPLGASGSESEGNIVDPIVQDGVTLSFEQGTAGTPVRMWNNKGKGQLRVYKNSTFTFTAPAGQTITNMEIGISKGTITSEQGTYSNKVWAGQESSVTFSVAENAQINSVTLTLAGSGEVVVAAPVITPATGTYYEAQTVSISAAEGLKIMYYTGEDEAAAKEYTEPFSVAETTTVTAWAEDADANKSSKVTSVITIEALPEYTTIAAMKEAATKTKTRSAFKFENLLVTGVAKTSLYVSDGTDGFLFYGVNPTVKAGDKISGTISGDLYLYNGLSEMAVTAYEGVTVVSEGNEVKPVVVEISDITGGVKEYENEFVRLENVSFAAEGLTSKNVTLVDGNNEEITLRDNFGVLADMVFDTSRSYNVNVFVANYNGNAQLYPLTADDIQIITNLAIPEAAWEKDTLVMFANDARDLQNKFTTNSDGAVTYTSSNEDVVTVDENGVLTWKKDGVATIYAETPETENYLASRVSFVYAAITGEGKFTKPYTVADARFLYGTDYLTGEKVWVKGSVVGYVDGASLSAGAKFEAATEGGKSNLLLADDAETTESAGCLPVQLPAGMVREGLQPSTDYKAEVWIYGSIEKYFSVAGLKAVSNFSKDGENQADGINAIEAENAQKAIFTLSGQKVNAITKGGVYIIGGKKIMVK